MNQIRHQFLTDLTRLRWPLLGFAFVLLGHAWYVVHTLELGYSPSQQTPEDQHLALRLTEWLPFLSILSLGTLLFRADPAHAATAFWPTRPWSRGKVGLAKALFLIVCIAVPFGLASLAEPLWFRVGTGDLIAEFIGESCIALLWIWAVWLISALASRWTWAAGLALLMGAVVVLMKAGLLNFAFSSPAFLPMHLILSWIYALPQQVQGADPTWLLSGIALPVLTLILYTYKRRRIAIGLSLLVLTFAPLITMISFQYLHVETATYPFQPRPPSIVRKTGWKLDAADLYRNSDYRVRAFLTSDVRNEYVELRDSEIRPLIDGVVDQRNAQLLNATPSETSMVGFLGETQMVRPSLQAEVTTSTPIIPNVTRLAFEGWADFDISKMSPWASFTLDKTSRKDGIACWISERKPQHTLEPSYTPTKTDGPIVVYMTTIGGGEDARLKVKVEACNRRWMTLLHQWQGQTPTRFLAALWNPETKRLLNHTHRSSHHTTFEFGSDTSDEDIEATRIDVIRLTNKQRFREHFTDHSVTIRLPQP